LFHLFIFRAIPEHIRSDNGPEFTAKAVRKWPKRLGVETLFIEPGSPWENGYIESFNGKLRDELLNREIFTTLEEAKVLIEQWRGNDLIGGTTIGGRPLAAVMNYDIKSRLPLVKNQTLVTAGTGDSVFSHLETAQKLVPRSRVIITPNAGEGVTQEKPQEFAATIIEFLNNPGIW